MADKTWSSLNKGAYSAVTAYTVGDFVSSSGSYYTCIQNSTGNAPTAGGDNAYWKLVASKGDTGTQGDQGIQGIQGETGPTGTSFIWKGDWSGATAYVANDVVASNGSAYVCILASTNNEPPNATYWNLLAQKGLDGEGAGDVVGPALAVGDNFAAFDSTTGKLIKDSGYAPSNFDAAGAAAGVQSNLTTHEGDTSAHGVTGDVVGTTDTQNLENKTITSPILQGDVTGWIADTDTWVYASATTFTIAGVDRTAMFPKGTKIKLTQTTAKYFYVISSAFSTNTTITVSGGSDYSLANAAITSPNYSYAGTPQGFPTIFNVTPTVYTDGGGTVPTYSTSTCYFSISGRVCRYVVNLNNDSGGTAGSGTGLIRVSTPLTIVVGTRHMGSGTIYEAGGTLLDFSSRQFDTTSTYFTKAADMGSLTANDQSSAARYISFEGYFLI